MFLLYYINRFPNLKEEWEERQNEDKNDRKNQFLKEKKEREKELAEARKLKELSEYKTLMDKKKMTSNTSFEKTVDNTAAVNYEEDFM